MIPTGRGCAFRLRSMRGTALLIGLACWGGWCASARAGLFDDLPTPAKSPPAVNAPPVSRSFSHGPAAAATQPLRLPVPGEASQQAGEQQVKEAFGQKIEAAKTIEDRLKISAELIDAAAHANDAACRFALLREAENLALQSENICAVLSAQNAMQTAFDLSTWPAAGDLFQKLERLAVSADDRRIICLAMIAASDDAIDTEHFAQARQIGEQTLRFARKSQDREFSAYCVAQLSRISACEVERKRIAPAIETLSSAPDDPAANATVGKFECFLKHNWLRGLPMLAHGNNAPLKSIAEKELNNPSNAVEQSALADGWWDYAASQPAPILADIRLHAGMWYARAAASATGGAKTKAQQRSADYMKSVSAQTEMAGDFESADPIQGFDGTSAMLRSLPPSLFPASVDAWDDKHRKAVNDALARSVVGRIGTFAIYVGLVSRTSSPESLQTINRTGPLGRFTARIKTSFDPAYQDQWSAIHENSVCVVIGHIREAEFIGTQLNCLVTECRLSGLSQVSQNGGNDASAGPAKSDLNSIEEVISLIPVDLMPKKPHEWGDKNVADKFGFTYDRSYKHKTITFRFDVADIHPVVGTDMLLVSSVDYPIVTSHFHFIMYLPDTQIRSLGMQVGSHWVITGDNGGTHWGMDGLTFNVAHITSFVPQ